MHSKFIFSQADGRPLYLQLIEQIKTRIAAGDWKPGDELPSIRMLAAASQVSVITVKRAYSELEHEGVIVTQQGKGSFVSEQADTATRLYQEELDRHVARAAELGRLLGLGEDELDDRLRQARGKLGPAEQ